MATYDLGTIGYTLENTGGPKTITELKQLAQAGIEAHRSTTQLSQGNRLSQYFASVDKQITAVNRNMQNHNRFLAQAGQQSNRFGVVTQQAGYQIGDFLVQVQSGTNWMVAFGQQATQLVGVLPLLGAGFMGLSAGALVALSAGLGIVIPLITALGAVWMRTSDEVEVGASEQKQAYESVTQALENLRLERQMEMSGTGSASEQTLLNEIVAVSAERKVIAQELLELESRIGAETSLQIAAERGRLAVRDNELRLIEQRNRLILDEIESERVAREKALAINEQMLAVELAHARAAGQTAAAAKQIDFTSAVSSAAQLADQLGISVGHASRMLAMGFGKGKPVVFDPRDPNYDSIAAQMSTIQGQYGTVSPFDPSRQPKVSGGGSGGRSSQLRKETELTKELTAAEKERQTILQSIEGSLESGFMSMVDGTKSVKDAFKSMAAEIIKELYRVYVVQQIVGAVSGGIGSFFGGSAPTSSPRPMARPVGLAVGGSIMRGKSYLVGENGPEMVIPRHSGTVVNANQTANAGAGSGSTVVNNNITVTGSDAAMVRAEVAKMIPQITNATKAAVIDARLRGGQMKQAFR
jgi:hypothetical protein